MRKSLFTPRERGFAVISTATFVGFILLLGVSLVTYVMSGRKAGQAVEENIRAVQAAEAGVAKSIYCLNATDGTDCGGTFGLNYAGETAVILDDVSFSTTVAGSGATRTIASIGMSPKGHIQTILVKATTIPPTDDIDFGYALQSGDGGVHLENNASVTGTLYTSGNVDCQTTAAVIDGDIWISTPGGSVDSCHIIFDTRADITIDSLVDRDAYYRNDPADISGTTVGANKYPGSAPPPLEPLPTPDYDFWRTSAEAGGIIFGDFEPADNSTLGPKKIIGNLTLNNNVDVTVGGPIWVVGDITTSNNSSLTLDAAFGATSTALLIDNQADTANDGYILINNNTSLEGSGDPKSHLLLISTNTSMDDNNPAISISNNADGAIFLSPDGVMRLQNNAGAKSLAAKRIFVDQNGVINYIESELASLEFSNSPGGIWRILEGSWREVN